MTTIVLDGRRDTEDYFRLSGIFDFSKLPHTPFLAFVASEGKVEVKIVDNFTQLLQFPDETSVMGQWRGEWKSDFFQFTVGDCRIFIDKKNAPLKTATNVIKVVGPQGGFRNLSYEYIDNRGQKASSNTSVREEASRLETFFAQHGIEVQVQQRR